MEETFNFLSDIHHLNSVLVA